MIHFDTITSFVPVAIVTAIDARCAWRKSIFPLAAPYRRAPYSRDHSFGGG